jgi:phosphoesterase RecJ-like protein
MPIDWSPFVDLVHKHQRFLLTTHVRPDGDGLGSMLALNDGLTSLGKHADLTVGSVIPPRYDFLDPHKFVKRFNAESESLRKADAVIVMDTGTWNQLGDVGTFIRQLSVPKIVIDHHPTQDDLGATRLVDTAAEATGRLTYEALSALGVTPSSSAASCMFVALAMDTGWFRHGNTTPVTFALAADLVRHGAKPTELYECLFEQNTLARQKLTGVVLGRIQVTPDGLVAYSELRREDYATTGATPQDSEDMINHIRSVIGTEVGLFFMEQPRGGVKVSFRSRSKVDVGKVAESFGGGGHRLASGAILETSLDEARRRVLEVVHRALQA